MVRNIMLNMLRSDALGCFFSTQSCYEDNTLYYIDCLRGIDGRDHF